MSERQSVSVIVKFGGIQAAIVVLLFILSISFSAWNEGSRQQMSFELQTTEKTELLTAAVAPQVFNFNTEGAQAVLDRFLKNPENLAVRILDDKGGVFLEKARPETGASVRKTSLPIEYDGNPIGTIEVSFDAGKVDRDVAMKVAELVIANVLLLGAVLVSLILMLITLILRPLKRLQKKIEEVSHGDGDLTKAVEIVSNDEMGHVAASFNRFLGTIRDLVVVIRKTLNDVLDIQAKLVESTSETSAGLVEITANIESIQTQIQRLDLEVGSAATAVQSSLEAIATMGNRVTEQNQHLEGAAQALVSMLGAVQSVAEVTSARRENTQKLREVTDLGGQKLRQTTALVAEVNLSLGDISNMIKIINGISAQTNLLAMNAAIEAAHAGDAGRGFSVVADEIRKLAEHSATNSKGIGQILKLVVTRIADTNTLASETGRAFEQIQSEVDQVDQALGGIVASTRELVEDGSLVRSRMDSLKESNEVVQTEADNLAARSREMAQGMTRVTEISAEVRVGMGEIAEGTRAIAAEVEAVNQQAIGLTQSSDHLGKDVGQFRV